MFEEIRRENDTETDPRRKLSEQELIVDSEYVQHIVEQGKEAVKEVRCSLVPDSWDGGGVGLVALSWSSMT